MRFYFNNVNDDLVFRDLVIRNEKPAVDYFLGVFSKPILEYVGKHIAKVQPSKVYDFENQRYIDVYNISIIGAYYEFIAKQFLNLGEGKKNIPQWDALKIYKGKCRLYTYVNVITTHYFYKHPVLVDKGGGLTQVPRDIKEALFVDSELLFQKLCDYLYDEDDSLEFSQAVKEEIDKARDELRTKMSKQGENIGERDYWVLKYSVVEEYNTDETAKLLESFFNHPLAEMERTQVQSRLSQWKLRAIQHLTDVILASANTMKYPNLRGLIIRHNNIKNNKGK